MTGTLTRLPGGGQRIVREYTSSATWTKPPGLRFVEVIAVGAGGGGGAGARQLAPTARAGGAGGGAGAIARRIIDAESLGDTESITIGVGGIGAVGRTTNGLAVTGGSGTNSSFGILVIGRFGTGGSSSGGLGGSVPLSTPRIYGTLAGNAGSNPTVAGTTTAMQGIGAPGGGGGGSISAASPGVASAGGAGGRVFTIIGNQSAAATGGGAGTGTNGGNGASNVALELINYFDVTGILTTGIGASGAGGGSGDGAGTIDGGAGGSGGNYGAGGGGGGGATDPRTSGAGGNGADGLVIVVEYY
jgi:hypothetical protein